MSVGAERGRRTAKPRATNDADVVTELLPTHFERLRSALGERFSLDEEDFLTAARTKLRWYRLGGEVSDRQWRDVLGVISVCRPRLDLEYLRRWCADQNVGDLLERALSTAP
jgi:hypothetical protein